MKNVADVYASTDGFCRGKGHWKRHHLIDRIRVSIRSIVTMAYFFSNFKLKRDIGRKMPIFHTPLYSIYTIP